MQSEGCNQIVRDRRGGWMKTEGTNVHVRGLSIVLLDGYLV